MWVDSRRLCCITGLLGLFHFPSQPLQLPVELGEDFLVFSGGVVRNASAKVGRVRVRAPGIFALLLVRVAAEVDTQVVAYVDFA